MHINLTPQLRPDLLTISRAGDSLTINGEDFDFSTVAEGETLPRENVACDWLASDVTRIGGELHLTLILPIGSDAPEASRFPDPITVTADGPVDLPPYSAESA